MLNDEGGAGPHGEKRQAGERHPLDAIVDQFESILADRPSVAMGRTLSSKGAQTLGQILAAARAVFVEDGHAGLSLRKVADRAGVGAGNVSYYFKSKQGLLRAMLREALAEYVEQHVRHLAEARESPLEALLNIVTFYVHNARTAHAFFFQLWGYAGADGEAKALVRELYQDVGRLIFILVRKANPALDDRAARRVVLQIFSLEEGTKLFIGLEQSSRDGLPTVEADVRELAKRLIASS